MKKMSQKFGTNSHMFFHRTFNLYVFFLLLMLIVYIFGCQMMNYSITTSRVILSLLIPSVQVPSKMFYPVHVLNTNTVFDIYLSHFHQLLVYVIGLGTSFSFEVMSAGFLLHACVLFTNARYVSFYFKFRYVTIVKNLK